MRPLLRSCCALVVLSAGAHAPCTAQSGFFEYHPSLGLQLGRGFDLDHPATAQAAFLDVAATGLMNDPGVNPDTRVAGALSLSFITDRKELNKSMTADAYVRASYMGQSLSASYNVQEEVLLNESAITLAIHTSTRYAPQHLGPLVFLHGPDSLRRADFDRFKAEYGTHYVSGIERGLDLTVFVTITYSSAAERRAVGAQVDFRGGSALFRGAAGVRFNSELNKAATNGALLVQIASRGGGNPFTNLSALVNGAAAEPNAMQKIQEVITTYMATFTDASAYVARFYYLPMPDPNDHGPNARIRNIQKEKLVKLLQRYDELTDLRDRATALWNSPMFSDAGTVADRTSLTAYVSTLGGYIDSLERNIARCKAFDAHAGTTCACCNVPLFDTRNAVYRCFTEELDKLNFYLSEKDFFVRPNKPMFHLKATLPCLKGRTLGLSFRCRVMANGHPTATFSFAADYEVNAQHYFVSQNSVVGWRYVPQDVDVVVPQNGEVDVWMNWDHAWGPGDPLDGALEEGASVTVRYVR